MSSLSKDIVVFLLRETERHRATRDRYPPLNDRPAVRFLRMAQAPFLFRCVLKVSGRKGRMKIRNGLVNRVRIPCLLVPPDELSAKYKEAIELLCADEPDGAWGDYLEFGVYQGMSFLCMHKALVEKGLKRVRMFGFDSFQGLPAPIDPDDARRWQEGRFQADEAFTRERLVEGGVDLQRAFLIKGFFSDTLNEELLRKYDIQRAGIVMFDCDMYSSTKQALAFVTPLIGRQAVFVFDDWNSSDEAGGQKKAFAEFMKENPLFNARDMGTYCANATIFYVTKAAEMQETDEGQDKEKIRMAASSS